MQIHHGKIAVVLADEHPFPFHVRQYATLICSAVDILEAMLRESELPADYSHSGNARTARQCVAGSANP